MSLRHLRTTGPFIVDMIQEVADNVRGETRPARVRAPYGFVTDSLGRE